MISDDRSFKDNQISITRGEKGGNKSSDQHDKRFQSRVMSTSKCFYCWDMRTFEFSSAFKRFTLKGRRDMNQREKVKHDICHMIKEKRDKGKKEVEKLKFIIPKY